MMSTAPQLVPERPQGPGLFAGRSMGGYHLFREVASGGMAGVYLAHKRGPGGFAQFAAVKVVHPHLAHQRQFVDMFFDEARIAACINHPNVCRVLDFGCVEDTYYLAMEHLLGETLNRVLRTAEASQLAFDRAAFLASVLALACEGLHAAHEAKDPQGRPLQVVHRDVSPQNIYVTYDGGVRVLDFGIASASERLHTTRHGEVKGRFSYMSPEQMLGEAVDRRSDIWSLGVVLWEGLAGKRLFRRSTEAETIVAVTSGPAPSVPPERAQLAPELWDVALKALARDPAQRFQSAREMGAALAAYVSQRSPLFAAERSEVMYAMFAERIEAKEKLRALAEASDARPAQAPAVLFATDAGPSEQEESRLVKTSTLASLAAAAVSSHAVSERVPLPREVDPRNRWAVSLGLLGLCLAALGLWRWHHTRPSAISAAELHPVRAPIAHDLRGEAAQRLVPLLNVPAERPPPVPEDVADGGLSAALELDQTSDSRFTLLGHRNRRFSADSRLSSSVRPQVAHAAEPDEAQPPVKETRASPPKARPHERRAHPPRRGRKRAPPQAEPATPAPKPERGTLNVTTPGCWAHLFVGEQRLGSSPGSFPLEPGPYDLRLEFLGRGPGESRRVVIKPGEVTRLKLPCQAAPGPDSQRQPRASEKRT